jgi:ATP citrate (pro-S)-lyase
LAPSVVDVSLSLTTAHCTCSGELDDTAAFKSGKKWGAMEWPQPFGRTMSAAEETIHAADEKTGLLILSIASVCHDGLQHAPCCCRCRTPLALASRHQVAAAGASLKLTILNPKGRVWTMVAGGGASVIYTDTVGDLGYAQVRFYKEGQIRANMMCISDA